jgi:hypothetical protein
MESLSFLLEIKEFCSLCAIVFEDCKVELKIPKYGSVTLEELNRLQKCDLQWQWALVGLERPEAGIDRLGSEELAFVVEHLPMGLIQKGYEFMVNEVNQWQPIQPVNSEKKLTGQESTLDLPTTSQVALESSASEEHQFMSSNGL